MVVVVLMPRERVQVVSARRGILDRGSRDRDLRLPSPHFTPTSASSSELPIERCAQPHGRPTSRDPLAGSGRLQPWIAGQS